MKDIEELLKMIEYPQNYTDEEIQELMSDPDMQAYYELMVDAEAGFAQKKAKYKNGMRIRKIAAMFIGIILLSGFSFAAIRMIQSNIGGDSESQTQKAQIIYSHQQSTEKTPLDSIRTFEDVELQQILSELAGHYHVDVEYRNEQTRHIRLYTKWDTSAPLNQMIERLNNFEKVSIRLASNQIIAE